MQREVATRLGTVTLSRVSGARRRGVITGALRAAILVVLAVGCGSPTIGPTREGEPSIPPPRPVSTGEYRVGVYYFPGWPTREKWRPLDAFPERMPLLGYYAEGDPTVMDWQIKWAVEHGIAFFVFDWYWDRGQRQLEHALHGGYFAARFRAFLKFCLLWANHNPPGSFSEADLLAVVDYWITQYFRRSEYFTIDGKPVVIIFSPDLLRKDMGSPAVGAAIRLMRARMAAGGFSGLFLIAVGQSDGADLSALRAEGYDATTGYNYPPAGMPDKTALRAPYDSAVDGYERIWNGIAAAGVLDYLPVTEPGWDSRPWHGETALVRTGRHPDKFKRMLERARAFTDRHPVAGGKKLVLVEAWNEYGEGAAIEPHREWGFRYLDAIREVFGRPRRHRHVTPDDLGLSVPRAP